MDGWNTCFLLGWPVSRSYVSFREGIVPSKGLLSRHLGTRKDSHEAIRMKSMLSKLKWLVIETWPTNITNSWWCMGSPAGVSIRCVIFRFDLQFYFLRISIQGFIVQTIMFFHDEVSSSGFKDKICRERLPKQKGMWLKDSHHSGRSWGILPLLVWSNYITQPHPSKLRKIPLFEWKSSPKVGEILQFWGQKLVVHPSWSFVLCFFHVFCCQKSYRNWTEVFLDVLGFWVPQKTCRRRTKFFTFYKHKDLRNSRDLETLVVWRSQTPAVYTFKRHFLEGPQILSMYTKQPLLQVLFNRTEDAWIFFLGKVGTVPYIIPW